MVEKKEVEELSIKLNLIASLLIDIRDALTEKTTMKDKISYLLKKGIEKDEDISSILGITKSHSSKEKAMIKKNG
ncbi:hypothetical protein KAT80_03270 [Candidatus Pacearchaeota archaeon]|nr:hypothetical protein [Candidatus Pacearchaeota archaeon]